MVCKKFHKLITFLWLSLGPAAGLLAQDTVASLVMVSTLPGSYNEDVELTVTTELVGLEVYYSFVEQFGESAPLLVFNKPLLLSAVEGEVRDYRLVLTIFRAGNVLGEGQFYYTINKRRPGVPLVSQISGRYRQDLALEFDYNGVASVFYALDGTREEDFLSWDGTTLNLKAESGEKKVYQLQVYGLDSEGKASQSRSYSYTIDKTEAARREPALRIISPPTGVYANKQTLFIQTTNLSWVKYSLDGSDPLAGSLYWTGPELLDATGEVTLKLAGKSIWTGGAYVRQELTYTVTEEKASSMVQFDVSSGLYTDGVTVTPRLSDTSMFFYTTDGSSPWFESERFTEPLQFTGKAGELTTMELRLKHLKSNGALSEDYRHYYLIDQRVLRSPTFKVITSSKPYGAEVKVRVYIPAGTTVYYTLDGSLPDQSSLVASNLISVQRSNLTPDSYLVLMARAFNTWGESSEVVFLPLEFAPENSSATGVSSAQPTSGLGRELILSPEAGKKTVYEISSRGEWPPDPTLQSPELKQNLLIELPPGMARTFFIKTAMIEDDALSRVTEITYIIDRQPPLNPVLLDIPAQGLSRNPVTFAFAASEGKLFYQVSEDSAATEISAELSSRYYFPLTLEGRLNEEITYRIFAIAVDDLGNVSHLLKPGLIRIDQKAPPAPVEPSFAAYGSKVEQKYHLFWQREEEYQIYYNILTPAYSTAGFVTYATPLLIDFSILERNLLLECYQADKVGNMSPRLRFELDPGSSRTQPPVISGVEEGAAYNEAVTLRFLLSSGEIRYELTADGSLPAAVQTSSTLAGESLVLDAPADQEITYRLRARIFKAGVLDVNSRELLLSFVVDKKAPAAPAVEGIVPGGYYYAALPLRFKESRDTIFYSLVNKEQTAPGERGQFVVYSGPVDLGLQSGELGRYTLTAFVMDAAGNLSLQLPVWEFTLDLKSVYVAPSGADSNAGTRELPLKTLEGALAVCIRSGRNRINLAAATYSLSGTLVLSRDLELQGGFDPVSWQRKEAAGRSLIRSRGSFPAGSSLLDCQEASLKLVNIRLADPQNGCAALITQQRGGLELVNSLVELGNVPGGVGVKANGSKMQMTNTELSAPQCVRGCLLEFRGVRGELRGCRVTGPQMAQDFVALQVLETSRLILQEVILEPGKGKMITGLLSSASDLVIADSKIGSGAGSATSVAVNARDSNLELTRSILNGDLAAGYAINLLVSGGSSRITESIINVSSNGGAIGIKASGCDLQLFRSRIKGIKSVEFLYLVNLYNCTGRFFNNLLLGGSSADALCVLLDDTDSRWINNTILSGTGTGTTTGFLIKGAYKSALINNILVRDGKATGNALHLVGKERVDFLLQNNNFSGWDKLLHLDYISDSGQNLSFFNPQKYGRINTVELLNRLDDDSAGGNIHNNIDESYSKIFLISKLEEYHLSPYSRCIDAGLDLAAFSEPELGYDIEGDRRPAAGAEGTGRPDLGSDEYSP